MQCSDAAEDFIRNEEVCAQSVMDMDEAEISEFEMPANDIEMLLTLKGWMNEKVAAHSGVAGNTKKLQTVMNRFPKCLSLLFHLRGIL